MVRIGFTKGVWALGVGGITLAAMIANGGQDPVRVGPETLIAKSYGVGRLVHGVSGPTLEGNDFSLDKAPPAKGYVVAMSDVSCPLCQKYAPTLAGLEDRYRDQGIQFVYVNSSSVDDVADMRKAVDTHGFDGPYVLDPDRTIVSSLEATSTTEVFLLDSKKTLVYRGAVDDQYGLGYQKNAPSDTFLSDAIDSLLSGTRPLIEATTAPGCILERDAKPMEERAVTYYDQVSRILQRNCVECHRDGGVAPFALDSYEAAKNFKGMVKYVVENEIMPPWFAAPVEGVESPWRDDRSLTDKDRKELLSWIESGSPMGDPNDAPEARSFHDTWNIGEPDIVYEIPREIKVKATGVMPYIHMFVKTDFEEDRWVEALEILPTDRSVVHHVLVFVVTEAQLQGRENLDLDESAGFFMGYVPGTSSVVFPEGFAKRLPKGASLIFQLHFTPNGTATVDRTRLALKFADTMPDHELQVYGLANTSFKIPAGAPNHADSRTITVPRDVMVTALMPHMHVRGKAFRFDVEYPDGKKETLLDVPRYDFNWQLTYHYAKPKAIPKGSRITATGWFDNSPNNPANPDPTKDVRWGLQTTEEMLLGYMEFFVPGAEPGSKIDFAD